MDEKYLQSLHSQLGGESVFGKYEDFKNLITRDPNYAKNFYNNFGRDVLGEENDFYLLVKKKDTGVQPSMSQAKSSSSVSAEVVPTGPSVSSATKINKPSAYNKNIESSDWAKHQEITRKIQNAANKKDSAAVLAASKELKDLRSRYGSAMDSDKNLSEDVAVTQRIVSRYMPEIDVASYSMAPIKKQETLVPMPKTTAPIPTKERATQENDLKKFEESLGSSVDLTDDELKYLFALDNIELGTTVEGQAKEAETQATIDGEFSDNEGLWNSSKKLYNKFLTSANASLLLPMANVGMASEAKVALTKAAQQLAKEKPDGSATEEEILERAKQIRAGELNSKAKESLIEDWARNGGNEPEKQNIANTLGSVIGKINTKEIEFKKKAKELNSIIEEIKTIDPKDTSPENVSRIKTLSESGEILLSDINENYRYLDNDLKNLSDFKNELDLFKRNYSTLTTMAARVNVGILNLAKGAVGVTNMLSPNYDMYMGGGLGTISSQIDEVIKGQQDQVEKSKSISEANDVGSFLRISGQVMAEQLPQLVVNAYTGGSAKGLAALGASAAGQKYEEIKNKDEYTQNQKLLASIGVGLFEVVSEKIESNVLKRALPSARVAAAAANGATRLELDAMRAELKSGIKGSIKSTIDKIGSVALNANQEGISEVVAQVGGNMVDKYVLNNKKVGLLDGVQDAYLTGAVMGGAITASPIIASKVISPFIQDPDGRLRANNNRIKQLTASLEKVTSQESRDIINESISKTKRENEVIVNGGIDVIGNLTPQEIREGVANYEEIQKIKSQFLVIKGDKNLTDAEKKSAMAPLNARYDELVQRRQDIINKANAIQEQGSGKVPVQPETRTSEEVEQRVPESEPQGTTEQGQEEKVTPESYVADLQETKNSDPEQYWSVDSVSEEAAKDGTVISDTDGGALVSKDGDIKGLFKKATSKAKGVAQRLLNKAVDAGGIKLDNFDNYLSPIYKKAGFRVVSRLPFNEEYAPDGWNKEKHGTPDVVAMVYDPDNKLNIEEKTFNDYDEAMAYRDSFVDQARKNKEATVAKEQGAPATTKTKLGKNIKKSIAKVFPDLGVSEFNNAKEMKDYVAKKYGQEFAENFAEDDAARAIFDKGKIVEVLVNQELSDETTMPHEIWHGILSKAFGENETLFDSFRKSIDKALRDNGYEDIADELDAFAINPEYIESDTMASEWLVQFGGMLASARINPSKMNANQKNLLNQLKDIINKFAKAITGQEVFLEDATPENILDFMTSISDSLSRGEDISVYFKPEETIKDTSKIFNSKAQKIGNFEIDYFEDAKDFKKLEDDGYVVQNSSISNISGEPVAVHQPDSLLVGNVKYNGKQIIDGNGGVYYTLKFGNVWASGKKTSASGLAKLINSSRKNSSDGKGRLLLVMGSRDKMISSVQGVKASMEVIENLVFDGLIARSDFRKALTIAGKKYNIDFSGSDSSAAIKKDISDKFMNVNDSSFQRRGDFFSDLITEIGKTESATKNIKEIQKALGATKNISFSKQGVRNQIGVVLSERLTQGVPSGHYYAYIEVDDDVDIIEDKQHESYPWSIVQKNGKRPVLHVLNERLKATETITKEDGSAASNAELGLAQRGMGYGIVSKSMTTKAQKKERDSWQKNGVKYTVGDIVDGSNLDELSGGLVDGRRGDKYILVQEPLSSFTESREELLRIDPEYAEEESFRLDSMKDNFEKTPPIPPDGDGMHRIVAAKELGFNTILMWKKLTDYEGKITTKAQKAHPYIPKEVFEKLTTDKDGNIVFNHYSWKEIDEVRPSTGSGSLITSKEEQQALSSVGGLAMYYTQIGQKESHVGNIPNTVVVDPSKVYYMNKDVLNFYDEAKEQFLDHMNRNNNKRVNYAFNPNYQVAWITKVATEKGFDMVIAKWRNDYDFRAQTKKTLKPEAEVIPLKQIEDNKISVGDKIFFMGREVVLTDVDDNGVYSYEGSGVSGKIPLENAMKFGKFGPIYKLSSKPQKARLQKEVAGIIEKSTNRGATKEKAYENALNYLQKSKYYQDADDSEREALVRELRSAMGLKEKRNISVGRILGAIKDIANITAKESTLLKEQIKLEGKAAKAAAKEVNDLRKALSLEVSELAKSGKITTKQAATIIKRIGSVNLSNPSVVDGFVDYMTKVFNDADYSEKVRKANENIKKIKRFYKGKDVQATVNLMAKNFLTIDPKKLSNIDEYLAMSTEVLQAVMPTSTPAGVKMRVAADVAKINDYINEAAKEQAKKVKDDLLSEYQYLVDAGVIDDSMSYDEIVEIIDSIEDNAAQDVLDKGEDVRQYIVKMFNSLSSIGKEILSKGEDPVTGLPVDLSDDQKAVLKKFLNMDIENMSIKDAKLALEYLSNFITNGITDGMAGIVETYSGSENLKTFIKTGAKFRKLKLFFSTKAGRLIAEQVTNLNILLETALGGQDRSSVFRRLSGFNEIVNGNAKARKIASVKLDQYYNKFKDVKDFFTAENNIERGVLAFLVRTNESSDELERRKGLIEQSIEKMMEGNEQEVAKAEIIKEVYERIGKNAKTTQDVFDAAKKENRDAVNWWINNWNSDYDRLKDVSLNIYNTDLGKDKDYTPDVYGKIEEESEESDLGKSAFMLTTKDYTVKKKTGVLMEAKKPSRLSKNRVVSFDFDTNNARAYEAALIDIETAAPIRMIDGFINSKEFSKLGGADDVRLIKGRINGYIGEIRGKNFVSKSSLDDLNKGLDKLGSIGASMALGGISQPFKQTIPVAVNTLINTGGYLDLISAFDKNAIDFINNSGFPIANRGLESTASIKTADRYLEEASRSNGNKAIDLVKKAGDQYLNLFLKNPDVFIARAAFLSYYKKELKRRGVDTNGIDWSTHEINKSAAQYAQDMVDRQQNVSDAALMGDLMTSKDPLKQVVKKTVFTFMSFVMNQKARMYSDIITLKSNQSTREDKRMAAKSLAALSSEMATFSLVGGAIAEFINWSVISIMGVDEDEEQKAKRRKSRYETIATNISKDFLSPLPFTDAAVVFALNTALDQYYKATEKDADDEEKTNRFRLFEKKESSVFDNMGAAGITASRYMEMIDLMKMAYTGEFEQEFVKGKPTTKYLRDEDKKTLSGLSFVQIGANLGLLPSEATAIVRSATKIAKKRARREEDHLEAEYYKERGIQLPDYLK